jgi:hypothetical protein
MWNPSRAGGVMAYVVYVDDNYHYMDESERYKVGEFETCEAAQDTCRRIVDEFLLQNYKPGQTPKQLYELYTMFGEDPFIVGKPECAFSAWTYAKERVEEICQNPSPPA